MVFQEILRMVTKYRMTIIAVVATAAVFLLNGLASASITSNFITTCTGPFPSNQFDNDQSWESLIIDSNSNGVLDMGDSIWGVASFESIGKFGGVDGVSRLSVGQSSGKTTEYTAIFATKVLTKSTTADADGNYTFTMGPDAAFNTMFGNTSGTMIAFFDDVAKNFSATAPLGATIGNFNDAGNIFQVASDGLRVLEIGFTGAAGAATGGEGWMALAPDNPTALSADESTAGYRGFLDVLNQANGYELFDIAFAKNGVAGSAGPKVQFAVNGSIFASPDTTLPIGDDSNVSWTITKVLPEPTSLLIWGAGICAIVLRGSSRRRSA
jgi:hypothetical protein